MTAYFEVPKPKKVRADSEPYYTVTNSQEVFEKTTSAMWQTPGRMMRVDIMNGGTGIFETYLDLICSIQKHRDKLSSVDIIDLEAIRRQLKVQKYSDEHEYIKTIDKTILHISRGFFKNCICKLPLDLIRRIFTQCLKKKSWLQLRTYNRRLRQAFSIEYLFNYNLSLKNGKCLRTGFILLQQYAMSVEQLSMYFASVTGLKCTTAHFACRINPSRPSSSMLLIKVMQACPKLNCLALRGPWEEICELFSRLPNVKNFYFLTEDKNIPKNYDEFLRQKNPGFTGEISQEVKAKKIIPKRNENISWVVVG